MLPSGDHAPPPGGGPKGIANSITRSGIPDSQQAPEVFNECCKTSVPSVDHATSSTDSVWPENGWPIYRESTSSSVVTSTNAAIVRSTANAPPRADHHRREFGLGLGEARARRCHDNLRRRVSRAAVLGASRAATEMEEPPTLAGRGLDEVGGGSADVRS